MEKIELTFVPLKKKEVLGDICECLICSKETMGEHSFNILSLGIHDFNSQEFMSDGEVIPRDKIISYAIIPSDKIQALK